MLKTSTGSKCVQLFWNDQFCSHFCLVIAVKDLPAVQGKRLCFWTWLLSNRPDIYCQTNKTKPHLLLGGPTSLLLSCSTGSSVLAELSSPLCHNITVGIHSLLTLLSKIITGRYSDVTYIVHFHLFFFLSERERKTCYIK